jgi:1-acyl-sn-glycerol-3-phosphate acyltransferase
VGIAISMVIQGWMVMNAHHGYTKSPKVKHPEMNDVKAGDPLLVVRFTDEDLQELQQRVLQKKIDELFEEPSSYEDEDNE